MNQTLHEQETLHDYVRSQIIRGDDYDAQEPYRAVDGIMRSVLIVVGVAALVCAVTGWWPW